MTQSESQSFLETISASETELVLAELAKQGLVISATAQDGAKFAFVLVQPVGGGRALSARTSPRPLQGKEGLLFSFGISLGQFQFQFTVPDNGDLSLLTEKVSIKKLQRRDNFRANVPGGFSVHFRTKSLNGTSRIALFQLIDLSVGGMGVVANKEGGFKPGDRVVGQLEFAKQDPLTLNAVIQHAYPAPPETPKKFGFKFESLDGQASKILFAWALELSRASKSASR